MSRQRERGGGGASKHPDSQAVMGRRVHAPRQPSCNGETHWLEWFQASVQQQKRAGFWLCQANWSVPPPTQGVGVGPPAPDFMCFLPDCSSPGPFPLGLEFTHSGVRCHRTQTEGAEAQLLELETAPMRPVPQSQLQDSPVS